jgi:hypothetical protein
MKIRQEVLRKSLFSRISRSHDYSLSNFPHSFSDVYTMAWDVHLVIVHVGKMLKQLGAMGF